MSKAFPSIYSILEKNIKGKIPENVMLSIIDWYNTGNHEEYMKQEVLVMLESNLSSIPMIRVSEDTTNLYKNPLIPGLYTQLIDSFGIIKNVKTTLFNALLMIPGGEHAALAMLKKYPHEKFATLGEDQVHPIFRVQDPSLTPTHREIVKELVSRKSFQVNTSKLDFTLKARGEIEPYSFTIIKLISESKDYELLRLMLDDNHYDFNELLYITAQKAITPLMFFVIRDDLTALKMLIKKGVDINTKVTIDDVYGNPQELNALSLTKFNWEIAELLISNGIDYSPLQVVFTQNWLKSFSKKNYEDEIKALYAKRAYLEKSVSIIETDLEEGSGVSMKANINDVRKLNDEHKQNLIKINKNAESETDRFDGLLLEYFVSKNEECATKLQALCSESNEIALRLISQLSTQYSSYANVDAVLKELIHDHKLIHKYFQDRKKAVQYKMSQISKEHEEETSESWEIDGQNIAVDSAIEVQTKMQSKLYIKIDMELDAQYSSGFDSLKLLPKNSLGKNGIKLRYDIGAITLKTKALGDQRLVASKIYKNSEGNMLIIFKEMCNHKKVENWSKGSSTISIVDLIGASKQDEEENDAVVAIGGDDGSTD